MWSKPKSRPAAAKWEAVNKRSNGLTLGGTNFCDKKVLEVFHQVYFAWSILVQLCKLSGAALFNQGKIRDNKLDSGERVIENVSYVTSQAIQGAMVRLGEKTIQEVCINKICYSNNCHSQTVVWWNKLKASGSSLDLLRESVHHTTRKSILQGNRRPFFKEF